MAEKPKLAVYWAASCGGCEIAFVDLHDRLLQLTSRFELFFCPALVDTKKQDVEALADGALALTLFDGALRTEENVEMAHLLRRKSRVLVAYGACACGGGIPALSNLSTREQHLRTIFGDVDEDASPREETRVAEGALRLPRFDERVQALASVVSVDYSIPGCPPEPDTLWSALVPFVNGGPLPERGSVLGGGKASVCDECARHREGRSVARFLRVFEREPDPAQCLLDQGFPCVGPGTRGGCGARCPAAQMPCSGCYGPPDGVYDQAAKLVAAFGSLMDGAPSPDNDAAALVERIERVLDSLPDPAGTFGRFGLGTRPLRRDDWPREPGA